MYVCTYANNGRLWIKCGANGDGLQAVHPRLAKLSVPQRSAANSYINNMQVKEITQEEVTQVGKILKSQGSNWNTNKTPKIMAQIQHKQGAKQKKLQAPII